MLLAYYIDEIRNLLPEDKKHLDDRLIARQINLSRSIWLKNEMNKSRPIFDTIKQTITGLRTELVDASEISDISTNSRLLRTVRVIPRTIKRKSSDTIVNVRSPKVIGVPFNYITKDRAVYAGNGKMNRRDVYCFLYNDRIYFKLQKDNPTISLIDYVSVEGVFEDPIDVTENYTDYDGIFRFRDMDYPISDTIWEYIKQQILANNVQAIETDINETVQSKI